MHSDPDLRNRVNVLALDDPGRDARGLQRARPDGRPGHGTRALPRCSRRSSQRTGCPVLVNTSFNVRGEPIVCTPEDAYRCFLATEMDALVLEDVVLLKQDVAATVDLGLRERHLAQFQLD